MVFDRLGRRTAGGIALTLFAVVVSVAYGPELPSQVVTHWDASGTPDGTMAKATLLVGGPALVAGIVLMFELIPRVDPLAENIDEFQAAYDAAAVLIAGFLVYTYVLVLAWNLGYDFQMLVGLTPAFAVLYVAIGFLLERAERNWFVGIRTPWTLSSEQVWNETHDLGGTLFKFAGVVALGALVVPEYGLYFVAGPAAAVALVTTLYSFVLYRRLGNGDSGEVARN